MKVKFNKEMTALLDNGIEKVKKETYLPIFKRKEFLDFLCKIKEFESWTEFSDQFGYDLSKEEERKEYEIMNEIERLEMHLGAYDGFIKGVKNPKDRKHNLRIQHIYLIERWSDIPIETFIPDISKMRKNEQFYIFEDDILDIDDEFYSDMEKIVVSQKIETCIRLFQNIKTFNGFTMEQEVMWSKLAMCDKKWKKHISQCIKLLQYLDIEKDADLIKLTTPIEEKRIPLVINKILEANEKKVVYDPKKEEKFKRIFWNNIFMRLERPALLEVYIFVLTDKDYCKINLISEMENTEKETKAILGLIEVGYSRSFHSDIEVRVDNKIRDIIIK